MEDLFLPGSDYLTTLSDYCLTDSERQDVLAWEDGALPPAENFQRWNLAVEGLLASFDE